MGKVTVLYNCKLLRDHRLVKDDLWIQNGSIINPQTVEYSCDESVDCGGSLVSPGFIDLKLNGGYGVDFSKLQGSDASAKIDHAAKHLPKTGVTSFCPTIVTSAPEFYHNVLSKVVPRDGGRQYGAGILGWHLDGPFISKSRPGAHDPELIQNFDEAFVSVKKVYGDLENVCLVTLAPEIPNAAEVIRQLTRWGIRVSLGHSCCTLEEAEKGAAAGATMLTHLFNAMPSFHHRDPSLVGLLAVDLPHDKSVFFGIIADGVHTHPVALRMAYRIAPKSLFLVTDGVAPLGLGKGKYTLGAVVVEVEGDTTPRCTVAGTDILSGSVATMDVCIRNLKRHTECSIEYALDSATLRPALAMGISHKKGTLDFGTDADLVFLDPETLAVKQTYIAGRQVYDASSQ